MICFINYLDSKNNFKETKKDFKSFEAANNWMLKNFEKINIDLIKFY